MTEVVSADIGAMRAANHRRHNPVRLEILKFLALIDVPTKALYRAGSEEDGISKAGTHAVLSGTATLTGRGLTQLVKRLQALLDRAVLTEYKRSPADARGS